MKIVLAMLKTLILKVPNTVFVTPSNYGANANEIWINRDGF